MVIVIVIVMEIVKVMVIVMVVCPDIILVASHYTYISRVPPPQHTRIDSITSTTSKIHLNT